MELLERIMAPENDKMPAAPMADESAATGETGKVGMDFIRTRITEDNATGRFGNRVHPGSARGAGLRGLHTSPCRLL